MFNFDLNDLRRKLNFDTGIVYTIETTTTFSKCTFFLSVIFEAKYKIFLGGMQMLIGIDHIVLNCKDVEYTADWYERVLGLKRGIWSRESHCAQIWKSKDKSSANWSKGWLSGEKK